MSFDYYYFIRDLGQPLINYIAFRILVPLGVNILVYIIARFSNRSDTSTDSTKNRVVSFAGLVMTGVIALAHSYFIPLWLLDRFILMIQAGLSFVFVLYAGILHLYDYPDQRAFTILCIIFSEVMVIALSIISYRLEIFNIRMLMVRERNFAGADKFENGFETDSVTGVYSKKYLTEEAEKILAKTNELDPCGVALIDVDDFKKINDEMGNDLLFSRTVSGKKTSMH